MENNIQYKVKRRMQEKWTYDEKAACSSSGEIAEKWVTGNRQTFSRYRDSLEIVREIYDHAYAFLCEMLGKDNISLPIDIRKLAEACDFTVSIENFSPMKGSEDRRFPPVAQLQMRRRRGDSKGNITGTIRIADYLGEKSVRFSIAHELGHYVLREHSPIGLNYLHELCMGMYPLCTTDELLMDLFAYGLLLPYPLFEEIKKEYEADSIHWPIDFSNWIAFLRDKTQIPEYHAVLAYQGIKKYALADKLHKAQEETPEWMEHLIRNLLQKQKFPKKEIVSLLQFEEEEYAEIQKRLPETVEWVQDKIIEEQWRESLQDKIIEDRWRDIYEDSKAKRKKESNKNMDIYSQEQPVNKKNKILEGCPINYKNKILRELYAVGKSEEQISDITGIDINEIINLVAINENSNIPAMLGRIE